MRARWIVVIAAAFLAQQAFFPASDGDATPPVGLGAPAAAEGPSPKGVARLVEAAQEWWEQLVADEVADDSVVYCVRGDDAEFLRASECARRGGRPDGPTWARH